MLGRAVSRAFRAAAGDFRDRVDRALEARAEDREHRHPGLVVDGIVAPFAGRHFAAVDPEHLVQLGAGEEYPTMLAPMVAEPDEFSHRARRGPFLLDRALSIAT